MRKFKGFPPGKVRMIDLPALFFSDLLPLIDDAAELKVTLFCFWALQQKEGRFRYLRRPDFQHEALMQGLAALDSDADTVLEAALSRAVERGSLLYAEVKLQTGIERLYFLNTALARHAVELLRQGKWRPGDANNPVEIVPERPNIYQLYEANIGPLTPMIAEALKDAEREYPQHWLEEAVHVAVANNARKWSYIQAVLERWQSEGKARGITERHDEQDGQRYISGKYADFIDH